MWPFDTVSITRRKEKLAAWGLNPETPRAWCALCGGHVGAFRKHHALPRVILGPHILPTLTFVPSLHVFYGEKVIETHDDLLRVRKLSQLITKPKSGACGGGE